MFGMRTSSTTRSGLGLPDERQDLGAVLGLADDLEPAVLLERAADAVEHEAMVVGEQDLHAGSLARAVDVALPRSGASNGL